jgi:hypothetical protein
MAEHLTIDVTSDFHNRLVARPALSQFGDQSMPVVMSATLDVRFFAHIFPRGLQ